MSLIDINLPPPNELRKGWSAVAAIYAAIGWEEDIYATSDYWHYHDGGGNWALLRKIDNNKFVLIGMDHEYSETYFREAAEYFEEEETDLLLGAPDWWGANLTSPHFENWVGFIYGWDGQKWQRANYDKNDGFVETKLLEIIYEKPEETIADHTKTIDELETNSEFRTAVQILLQADGDFNYDIVKAVVEDLNVEAALQAGRKFLDMKV